MVKNGYPLVHVGRKDFTLDIIIFLWNIVRQTFTVVNFTFMKGKEKTCCACFLEQKRFCSKKQAQHVFSFYINGPLIFINIKGPFRLLNQYMCQ